MIDFSLRYDEYRSYFDTYINKFCEDIKTTPPVLGEGMKYSLLLGGKRVRPVLMYAIGDLLNVDRNTLTPYACALEMIHTYSLIHDDLPEMDNDDFRRGKPSNHKKFGQANAVLAGDALLNTAMSVLFAECYKGAEFVSAAKYICDCAGIYGMLAGQSADLLHENDEIPTVDNLEYIYANKTAKLITAAIAVPSLLSGNRYFHELRLLGEKLGYLFQLTDDILDEEGSFAKLGKTIGKDEAENKLTAVRVYGLEQCKTLADIYKKDCDDILTHIDGDVEFLRELVTFVRKRDK